MGTSEIAQALGISRPHLYDIQNEKKPVSPDAAPPLGKAFGDGAAVWLPTQAAYDLTRPSRCGDGKVRPCRELPPLPRACSMRRRC
jgi:addiction module HigA family antidote